MDRYKNGKIYKIIDNTNGAIYIGSTCLPTLAKRLAKHRNDYREYLKGNSHYLTSFKILENEDFSIILLEEYPCETKDQLFARERYHIENNECVNKFIPSRTKKEYREANADSIKERNKKYYEANADSIKERNKEYYEANADSMKKKMKEYWKKYYSANADRRKEKFTCECGGHYTYSGKSAHFKTKKHLDFINE